MKNLTLLTLALAITTAVFAQKDSLGTANQNHSLVAGWTGSNELKLNLLMGILGLPEITYERLLKNNTGLGVSIALNIEPRNNSLFTDKYLFSFVPHYRVYFGKKKSSGLFIEGDGALVTGKTDRYYQRSDGVFTSVSGPDNQRRTLKFGLGVAAGAKVFNKSGFLGEVYGGVGRLFSRSGSAQAYPRVGVSVGKRF